MQKTALSTPSASVWKQLSTAEGHSLSLSSDRQTIIIRWLGEVRRDAFEHLHQTTERYLMHYGLTRMLCNDQSAHFILSTSDQLDMMGTIARLHNAGLRKIAMVEPPDTALGNANYLLQESASSIFAVQTFTDEHTALHWLQGPESR